MVDWTAFKPRAQVTISYRSELGYWNAEWGDFRLSQNVISWLFENVGNAWLWDERIDDDDCDNIILTFYFDNDDAAMLFKLTWT